MTQPRFGVPATLRARAGTALRVRRVAFAAVSLPLGPGDYCPEATAG